MVKRRLSVEIEKFFSYRQTLFGDVCLRNAAVIHQDVFLVNF